MPTAWKPAALKDVTLHAGLLAERQEVILDQSIEGQYRLCKTTGRIDALKQDWKEGDSPEKKPHRFWDSDLAKWIESAAYSLTLRPDVQLEAQIDEVVDLLAAAQQPDGYLNSCYTTLHPEKRFTNLRDDHELYCAGHLMEAAVAYYEATGKSKMLDTLARYADLIGQVFGPGKDQKHGYDGHEEVELALVKLARATGEKKYLDLAKYFVDARGTVPHFFDEEAKARGEKPREDSPAGYDYWQAHLPAREQSAVEGHSVRALYFFAGVADVARETGDAALLKACRRIFDNTVNRRMYITGGVGSSRHGERFTYDFDLPNESAYAETCASIALVFFAARMLNLDRDGRYGDVIEQSLYNTCLAGISLDGSKYFYANYLATDGRWHDFEHGYKADRQGWFGCACCPPNLARLLASIGTYAYSLGENEIAINLYADSSITLPGGIGALHQETDYPSDGKVKITLDLESPVKLSLHLRIPGWCEKPTLKINGEKVPLKVKNGYATLSRKWQPDDRLKLHLPMPPRRVYADPRVRHNAGRVALMRGPMVYCIESIDNGDALDAIRLPRSSKLTAVDSPDLLGGVVAIRAKGTRDVIEKSAGLYVDSPPKTKSTSLVAVPYYAWNNRGPGAMQVWIRED